MTHNERILNNYIFQIRDSFCLQQVMDHTGIPKTSCYRILKHWEKEGKIKRVSVSSRPVKYRFNYQTSPLKLIMAGTREAEVEAKAEKFKVSSRTIYRMEERGEETPRAKSSEWNNPKFDEYKKKWYKEHGLNEEGEVINGNDSKTA